MNKGLKAYLLTRAVMDARRERGDRCWLRHITPDDVAVARAKLEELNS